MKTTCLLLKGVYFFCTLAAFTSLSGTTAASDQALSDSVDLQELKVLKWLP